MEEKKKRFRPSLTAYRELERKVIDLEAKNKTLEISNQWVDSELKNLRERNNTIEAENVYLHEQMSLMMRRGFWARVFNREV